MLFRLDELDFNLVLKKIMFNYLFDTTGIYEVSVIKKALDDLVWSYVFIDSSTMNSSSKSVNVWRVEKKTVFLAILGFTPHWGIKPNIESIIEKKKTTKNNSHWLCDFTDGSKLKLNITREPSFHSFNIDKSPRTKHFCKPETIQFKKNTKKRLWNNITF